MFKDHFSDLSPDYARGRDPLDELRPRLARAWGDAGKRRELRWPLAVQVGRL